MQTRRLKVSAVLSYLGIGCSILSGLLLTPLILSRLGSSDYGVYHMAAGLLGYLSLLDFGFGETVCRFTARYRVRQQHLALADFLGQCVLLYGMFTLLFLVCGGAVWRLLPTIYGQSLSPAELRLLRSVFLVMMLNFAAVLPFSALSQILTAYEAFVFSRSLRLAVILLRFGLTVLFLLRGLGIYGLLLAEILLDVLTVIAEAVYCFGRLHLKIHLSRPSVKLQRSAVSFGFFLFLSTLAAQLQWRLGSMLLGVFGGANAVALLSLALQPVTYFRTLSGVIAGLMLPRAVAETERGGSPKHLTEFMVKVGRIQLMICGFLLVGFGCIGDTFLRVWAGEEYAAAYPICLLLMAAATLPTCMISGVYLLESANLHRRRAVVTLLLSVAGILPTVLLILRFSSMGAAVGMAISVVVCGVIATGLELKLRLQIPMLTFLQRLTRGILPVLVATGCFGALLRAALPKSILGCLGIGGLLLLFYLILLWFLGLSPAERRLLTKP